MIANPLDADHDTSPPSSSSSTLPIPLPHPIPSPPSDPDPPVLRRSARTRKAVAKVADITLQATLTLDEGEYDSNAPNASEDLSMLVDVEDPDSPSWKEAIASSEKDKWMEGAQAELRSLEEMEVYQLIPRSDVPPNRKILRGKFVCKLKRDETGNPVRHKVRWVAKGFQQVWGGDYTDTTSPTACLESMRTVLHLAASNDWRTDQYDVKTAFLNGVLPDGEEQFIEQPPGFVIVGKESFVWRLLRGLYGMRQSSRIWNKTLNAFFVKWGFKCAGCEWCIYSRHTDTGSTIVAVHVDDMLATSSNDTEAALFRSELESARQITALG